MQQSSSIGSIGGSVAIVRVLRDYKKIDVGFLARLLGRQPNEIEDELKALQEAGVVERDDDKVALADGKVVLTE